MSKSRDIADSAATINYIDGLTSDAQTQLNAKQASDAQLTDIAGLTPTDGNIIIGDGTNFVTESGSTARTSLGVAIGTDVQAYDSNLTSFVGTFTLPTSDGTADQVLKTNGSGTLGFATVSAGPTATSNVSMSGNSSIDFTNIPSGVSHIWVNVIQCSTQNTSVKTGIRLGTSGGFVTTAYNSSAGWFRGGGGGAGEQDTTDETTMLMFFYNDFNNRYYSGSVHLAKLADNKWVMSSNGGTDQQAQIYSGVGDITLSADLTQLRIVSSSGNWDDGQVNISYM